MNIDIGHDRVPVPTRVRMAQLWNRFASLVDGIASESLNQNLSSEAFDEAFAKAQELRDVQPTGVIADAIKKLKSEWKEGKLNTKTPENEALIVEMNKILEDFKTVVERVPYTE